MQAKRSLWKRVERLEAQARGNSLPSGSMEDQLLWQFAEQLLQEIDQNHARRIREDLAGLSGMRHPGEWAGITIAFVSRIADHVTAGAPLAFPTVVAEAYLENPNAGDEDACLKCRYKLPGRQFQSCPICGGTVSFERRPGMRGAGDVSAVDASEPDIAA
jgi:hypothetical protein